LLVEFEAMLPRSLLGRSIMIIVTPVVLLQVVLRVGFGRSIFWSEELVRFALVWVVMLSAGLATLGQAGPANVDRQMVGGSAAMHAVAGEE
jgi:TRAP-type C4-dicarboxylate transport system permease small subunit